MGNPRNLEERVTTLEAQVAELMERPVPEPPVRSRTRRDLEALQKRLDKLDPPPPGEAPSPPSYPQDNARKP